MTTLHSGSRNWPILGDKDGDWAAFAYLWPNYVRIDHKNIDNGTGNVAANTKTRKANLHSILALATQNNMQAREIIESRQTPERRRRRADVRRRSRLCGAPSAL